MPRERAPEAGQRQGHLDGDGQWQQLAGIPGEEGDDTEEQDSHRAENDISAWTVRRRPCSFRDPPPAMPRCEIGVSATTLDEIVPRPVAIR